MKRNFIIKFFKILITNAIIVKFIYLKCYYLFMSNTVESKDISLDELKALNSYNKEFTESMHVLFNLNI